MFFLCLSATLKKPKIVVFSHTRIRVARHKQFHFSAFTLHPRIHQLDIQSIAGEQKVHFCLHRGWIQKGEAFTRIILSLNKLGAKGEAVKEKIEKRRTRALRVRVGGRSGRSVHFWERVSGSWWGTASGEWTKRWHAYSKNIAPSKNKSLKHQKQRAIKGLLNFALVGWFYVWIIIFLLARKHYFASYNYILFYHYPLAPLAIW